MSLTEVRLNHEEPDGAAQGINYDALLADAENADASIEERNARWWPQRFALRRFFRPWLTPIRRLPIYHRTLPIADEAMCSYLAHRIDTLAEHWDHYPAEGLIRLGGASCTLAGHDEAYRQHSRSIMYGAFGDLYTLILGHLKSCLETDAVRYSDHGFAPGMLINQMPKHPRLRGFIEGRLATAGFHFDSQASFAFPHCHPDWYQISFLLPLELPVGGHGLLLFEATQETKMERAILSRRAYHPYRVGEMLVFNGAHWHVPGPMALAGGRRIMVVGHGLCVNGTWELYY